MPLLNQTLENLRIESIEVAPEQFRAAKVVSARIQARRAASSDPVPRLPTLPRA